MHLSSIVIVALAALSSAAPIEVEPIQNATTLEERNTTPPLAMFFFDDHCTYMGFQVKINFDKYTTGTPIGGPWGTRSAWFTSTNGLNSWTIESGPKGHPKDKTVKPDIAVCVAYRNEIYVTGDTSVSIHT